jgi:hypothetical protein
MRVWKLNLSDCTIVANQDIPYCHLKVDGLIKTEKCCTS